jgi:hypothetical protein
MAEKLPLHIKEAIHKYYVHRQRQARDTWNKEADLDLIFETAKREGWSTQACAGHFWFSKKVLLGTHVIEVTETSFPDGGTSNIKDDNEPFGALSEITNALRKVGKKPLFINANPYKQNNSKTEVGNTEEGECI